MNKKIMLAGLAALSFCGGALAKAEPGHWYATGGFTSVNPDASSDPLNVVEAVAGLPANSTQVDVNTNSTFGFTVGYQFTQDWSVELLGSIPFDHDASVRGSAVDGLPIGDTKHLPPTITAKYHFGPTNSKWSYFVGAGLNYTLFFDTSASDELKNTLVALGAATASDNVDLDLDNSFGIALQTGFDYEIDEHWGLRGNIWWLDIDSDAEVTVNGAVVQPTTVEIDPIVYHLALSYRF